ncbi:MAG: DinB family protein [Saprospiraceae bacterium]
MKPEEIIRHLEDNQFVFKALLNGKQSDEYHFRPDPSSWSLLEIICHLHDEEREDFRTRVKNTLDTPLLAPPSIDPQGWVKQRNYAGQNFEEKLNAFLIERDASIEWLKSLHEARWDNVYEHPTAGTFTAYSFLTNWLAHDYHHIRQINRRLYEYLKSESGVSLAYAGDW